MKNTRKFNVAVALGSLTAAAALLVGMPDASAQQAPGGGSFPGSFLVPGTNTSIKVGGFVKLAIIEDLKATGANAAAADTTQVQQIILNTDPRHSLHNGFRMHDRQSNINIDTRTPTAYGDLTTFVLIDFFGQNVAAAENASNTQNARVVYAYGTLGPLLAGQWLSLWADTDAVGETVDPVPTVGVMNGSTNRHPQVRYTFAAPGGFSLAASVENPEAEGVAGAATFNTNTIGGVDQVPDLLARGRLDGPWGHFALTGLLRTLKLKAAGVTSESKEGYGIEASGHINTFGKDALKGIAFYGKGLGHYITDFINSGGIQTASLATGAGTHLPHMYGASVAYTHWWTAALRSTAQGGYDQVQNNTVAGISAAALERRHYIALANLIWSPVPQVDLGIEYEWARRTVQSGATGQLSRIEAETVFKF